MNTRQILLSAFSLFFLFLGGCSHGVVIEGRTAVLQCVLGAHFQNCADSLQGPYTIFWNEGSLPEVFIDLIEGHGAEMSIRGDGQQPDERVIYVRSDWKSQDGQIEVSIRHMGPSLFPRHLYFLAEESAGWGIVSVDHELQSHQYESLE